MNRKILVTGAGGFVGTSFLNRIANQRDVEALGVYHRRQPTVAARNIRYVQADLRDYGACKKIVEGTHWVCMLAGRLSTTAVMAKNPLGPVTENTVIHTHMLEAAHLAGVEKYLWLSSTTGYPERDEPLGEEQFFLSDPPPPYESVGWMSRYIEKLSMLYATLPKSPMTVIALRPTSIYGEHDDFDFETCHALPAMVRRVVERHRPIEIWGSGEDGRDLLYVQDLIDACQRSLDRVVGFEAINIGSGKVHTLNEAVAALMDLDGFGDGEVVHVDRGSGRVSVRQFDCGRMASILEYTPRTSLRAGLASTLKWYRAHRTDSATPH